MPFLPVKRNQDIRGKSILTCFNYCLDNGVHYNLAYQFFVAFIIDSNSSSIPDADKHLMVGGFLLLFTALKSAIVYFGLYWGEIIAFKILNR